MTYRVIYSPSVRDHIREHVRYLIEQCVSAQMIERWYNAFFEAVDNLHDMPRRYPVDQPASAQSGFEVRKLTFRRYIVRYRVDDDRGVVEVLSFIHGSMRRRG